MSINRICICAAQIPFCWGGAEILVEDLNNQLKKRGFESEIIYIPFKWYPKEELTNSALIWRMLNLNEADGKKIDRVICTKFPSYVVNHPNKVVWLFHQHRPIYDLRKTNYSKYEDTCGNGIEDYKIIQQIKSIDNNSLLEAKKIFCISNNISNRLKKYNEIESEILYPPTKYEGYYRNGDFNDYIFVAGRLEPVKRLELMIESLAYTQSNIKFIIAGKGKHEENLKSLVNKLKLQNRVLFKGFVSDEDLIELYANALAVFFAPIDEDYGLITIEAFKSGKPVITTNDSGGVLEFVENNINGFITNGDPKLIAQKIDYLYYNKEICREMGMHGNKKVQSIQWDNVIEKLTMDY